MAKNKLPTDKIEELISWVSEMGGKGYFKPTTVANRVSAIKSIATILNNQEKADLKLLLGNLDDIVTRWATKTTAAPGSVSPTKSHVRSLIQGYLEYQKDPGSFRTKARAPKGVRAKRPSRAKKGAPPPAEKGQQGQEIQLPEIRINLQIHIAADAPDSQIDKIFESIGRHLRTKPKNV